MQFRLTPLIFIVGMIISTSSVAAPKNPDEESLKEFFAFPAAVAVAAYRSFIGQGIRSICPMTPSCSIYGREALRHNGLIIGSLKIVDRLNRCGHDVYLYPIAQTFIGLKFADPVGN